MLTPRGSSALLYLCTGKIKWRDVEGWVKGKKAELKTWQTSLKLTGLLNL